jgi:hypothetical protein
LEVHLALSPDEILALPMLHDHIQVQSASMIRLFEYDPRLSATFDTQQRWLMSHLGLSLYFRGMNENLHGGLYLSSFLDAVRAHGIASRNTADAYIKEMINYKYLVLIEDPRDKRMRPFLPTSAALQVFIGWLQTHLATLDNLTGGNRLAQFEAHPAMVSDIQPLIAEGLLAAHTVRYPEKTFSLFTWLDNGGVVMDWLITNMEPAALDAERVRVGAFSVGEMAARLNLSRTHLARKLREAEELGSIGWEGRRGHSVMWVSKGFRLEYAGAQAVKLSIIDQACEAVMDRRAAA